MLPFSCWMIARTRQPRMTGLFRPSFPAGLPVALTMRPLDCRNVCSRVVLVRRCPPVDQPFHGVELILGPVVAQQLAQCAKAGEAGFNQWIERNLAKPVIGLVVVYVSGVGVSDPASDGNVTLLEAKKSLHAAGQGLKNLFVSLVKSNF